MLQSLDFARSDKSMASLLRRLRLPKNLKTPKKSEDIEDTVGGSFGDSAVKLLWTQSAAVGICIFILLIWWTCWPSGRNQQEDGVPLSPEQVTEYEPTS